MAEACGADRGFSAPCQEANNEPISHGSLAVVTTVAAGRRATRNTRLA